MSPDEILVDLQKAEAAVNVSMANLEESPNRNYWKTEESLHCFKSIADGIDGSDIRYRKIPFPAVEDYYGPLGDLQGRALPVIVDEHIEWRAVVYHLNGDLTGLEAQSKSLEAIKNVVAVECRKIWV
jgi:hypothetical protein